MFNQTTQYVEGWAYFYRLGNGWRMFGPSEVRPTVMPGQTVFWLRVPVPAEVVGPEITLPVEIATAESPQE